ncbi:MAG: esterase [Aeromicrobium sp.]|jgi:dienelactone hydrolase|nr:esterase [Aeromicrobium sp.]
MTTEEYAPGRHLDVRGEGGPVVLLWHGRGADAREVLATLSDHIAGHGVTVVTPDWDAGRPDGGRADLLTSVRRAREIAADRGQDPDTIVVAGWSLGGVAAVSLALHARRLGVGVGGLVLIAPADGPRALDPISGQPLPTPMPSGSGRCRVDVVYGEDDTITPPDMVCGLELRLRAAGWSTSLHALDGDHGEVVGATYDERRDAFVPSHSARARQDATTVAAIVAAATASS